MCIFYADCPYRCSRNACTICIDCCQEHCNALTVGSDCAGKLFPGPHLYAGAAITVTWGLAAALVPAMTRGNDAARTAHITLNVVNIGLFAWQIPTGFTILQKVFQFTTWP